MNEEINIVIEKLCGKLGTSIQSLIPKLTRLNIIADIYAIITCIIVAAVLAAIGVWGIKNRKDEFDILHELTAILAFVCCVATVVLIIVFGCDLIGWLVSPEVMAFKQIVSMLK